MVKSGYAVFLNKKKENLLIILLMKNFLEDAYQKLVEQETYFQYRPRFIDYAVYNLRAAERKNTFALRQIKINNLWLFYK